MTPKQKAEELWGKYFQLNYDWDGATKDQWAKEGALIAVNEIFLAIQDLECKDVNYDYWVNVQEEIENL